MAGETTRRGYGTKHQRRRAWWAPKVKAGTVVCWRCEELIPPGTAGKDWHLGHDDHDRTITRGPEHALCNLRAAAARTNGTGEHLRTSEDW